METRIERHRVYRNEIINEGMLIDRLVDESNISKQYKAKIDALDANILANLSINNSMAKLISVNNNEMKEASKMTHFINLIDEKRINNMNSEIAEWSNKYQPQPIVDQKGNINRKWLAEDSAYAKFSNNEKNLEIQNASWANFQANSKNQIIQINELSNIADNSNAIENIKSISVYSDNKKNLNKIIYIIPSVLSLVSLLTIIVLLIFIISGWST